MGLIGPWCGDRPPLAMVVAPALQSARVGRFERFCLILRQRPRPAPSIQSRTILNCNQFSLSIANYSHFSPLPTSFSSQFYCLLSPQQMFSGLTLGLGALSACSRHGRSLRTRKGTRIGTRMVQGWVGIVPCVNRDPPSPGPLQ